MPVENWSDTVVVAHLADDPQFTEDVLAAQSAVESGHRDAVLDFGAVHMATSSNLARLLRLRKATEAAKGRLLLCSLSTQVWGTFLDTGLDKLFHFSDNVSTALATLQMR
jgi:anti-anti-sigma factor